MKDFFSAFLPIFVNRINLSFNDSLVPVLFKEAVLDPVISLDIHLTVYQKHFVLK